MTDTKRCSKCGEVKGLEEFNKDKNRKDGHFVYCKPCTSKASQQYRAAHADELRAKRAAYRAANLEDVRAYERARTRDKTKDRARQERYRVRHKDVLAARSKHYREANLEKVRRTQKASAEKAYARNPEKFREACRQWHYANPENAAARARKKVEGLSDGYVASAMRIRASDATPELIALKREQLAIKRMARELKKSTQGEPK